ncbi:MAG: OmpA family protein [Proteobacteria bacterium]|nr:OmpA family protein [Pseudomonadota bacterium]
MKKNLLITVSLFALASCAGNSQDVALREENLDISQTIEQEGNISPELTDGIEYTGLDASDINEKTLQAREDLNNITTNKVLFKFDSSALTAEAQEKLDVIANFVLAKEEVNAIIIQGHADERGTREYNLALGERRAVAVKKYLVGLGVSSDTIETISFGKEQPEDSAHNEAAWATNRRSIVLLEVQ